RGLINVRHADGTIAWRPPPPERRRADWPVARLRGSAVVSSVDSTDGPRVVVDSQYGCAQLHSHSVFPVARAQPGVLDLSERADGISAGALARASSAPSPR